MKLHWLHQFPCWARSKYIFRCFALPSTDGVSHQNKLVPSGVDVDRYFPAQSATMFAWSFKASQRAPETHWMRSVIKDSKSLTIQVLVACWHGVDTLDSTETT